MISWRIRVVIDLIIMQLDVIVYCVGEMGLLIVLAAGKQRRGAASSFLFAMMCNCLLF